MSVEEAIALNNIVVELTEDVNKHNKDDSWKDDRIKTLEAQVVHKDNLLGFYRKENKVKGLDNRNLKKTLHGIDSFLAMLCGKIAIGYKEKNDVINTLVKEMKEKEATVKKLNEVIESTDWTFINEFESNKKELDELKKLIDEKDGLISEQLVKIITKETEIDNRNERITVLEQKIFDEDREKIRMEKEREENSLKLKQLEYQIEQLQKHNHALEDDITQIENSKMKKTKCFSWLSRLFRTSSSQQRKSTKTTTRINKNNDKNNINNNINL